jgi:hypothetical protein
MRLVSHFGQRVLEVIPTPRFDAEQTTTIEGRTRVGWALVQAKAPQSDSWKLSK